MASVTLTSCQDFWDDLFGVESTPTTPETPSTPSESEEPKDDTNLTKTETGAEATVEDLANLTELLNQVKDDIAAKGEEEYVFEIKNEGLESTATDNVIEVPKVEGSNINLNFTNGVSTKETLVVKAAETASDTPVEAVNELTITMPASEGLNLELDMPETTVTLKAATGEVVYDEIVATTAINTLYIESGVTVKNLRVKGGRVKVKNGGKAETYVYAPTSNDEIVYVYSDGVQPVSIKDANGNEFYAVQDNGNNAYFFKNLKIIKGTADYANVGFYDNWNPIEKLTIAEGVTVRATGNQPSAKIIEGEGNGANLIDMANIVSVYDWPVYGVDKHYAEMTSSLATIQEMKGISFSVEPATQEAKDILASVDSVCVRCARMPKYLENCTLKLDFLDFSDNMTGATLSGTTIKGCKFESTDEDAFVHISVPEQTAEISSFKVNFTDCDFAKGFKFSIFMQDRIYEYDDDGAPVFYDIPFYAYYDEEWDERIDGIWRCVQTKDEIPEGATWEERNNSQIKWTLISYNNYYPTIAIKNCQYGGSVLTNLSEFVDYEYSYRIIKGASIRFEIDGTTYEQMQERDSQTNKIKYVLRPVQ